MQISSPRFGPLQLIKEQQPPPASPVDAPAVVDSPQGMIGLQVARRALKVWAPSNGVELVEGPGEGVGPAWLGAMGRQAALKAPGSSLWG